MSWSVKLGAIVALLLIPVCLRAADIDDIRSSCWKSTYQDDAGTFVVDARIELNGGSGTYTLASGETGQLTGLRYAYITPAPEQKVGVYGTWTLGNQSGGFTFRVAGDGQRFGGQWTGANHKRGTWSGTRD
jgi:hypothetical protein